MSNNVKTIFELPLNFIVTIAREERPDSKAFNCCFCGQRARRGFSLRYRITLNGVVVLSLNACERHREHLESKIAELQRQTEAEIAGYLERLAKGFFDENCLG